MADLLVREVDEAVVKAVKERAGAHGRSAEAAELWGRLLVPHAEHELGKQTATIALVHDLTVVTRNAADFAGTGARLINPFLSA